MTTREAAIAKLKQLPDSLLQQVTDFIDFLIHQQHQPITNGHKDKLAEAWEKWFDVVDQLGCIPLLQRSASFPQQWESIRGVNRPRGFPFARE